MANRWLRWRVLRAAALSLIAVAVPFAGGGAAAQPLASAEHPATVSGSPIRIALMPERNIFEQKRRYEPLGAYLSEALGRPVVFTLLDSYQVIFDEIIEHRVDGAFFSSMNGAIAQVRGGVEMLARPVDLAGASTYSAVLFAVNGASVTKDPRTWRGRNVALVNKVTTSGRLFPLSRLRASGYHADLRRHFGKVIYAGSHDAAILAVLDGGADLGFCKNTVYEDFTRRKPDAGRRLTVLGASAPVPSSALGVHPDLDPGLKRALRAALLGMHAGGKGQLALRRFGAQRFVETSLRDYEGVFAMARQAGVDLSRWPLHEVREGSASLRVGSGPPQ